MPFDLIPSKFFNAYNLYEKVNDSYIYMKMKRSMYRLPQARA